jgi:hypothetical protein
MSKRLIILSFAHSFVEWGPGCICTIGQIGDGADGSPIRSTVVISSGEVYFHACDFDTSAEAKAARALWLQAILGAPGGGLLRWDVERGQVVNELYADDATFAEPAPEQYNPETYEWKVGDWFMVVEFITTQDEDAGAGPFQVKFLGSRGQVWRVKSDPSLNPYYYAPSQIRPCPAPVEPAQESTTDTQSDPVAVPVNPAPNVIGAEERAL